jgi:hypothetical protein
MRFDVYQSGSKEEESPVAKRRNALTRRIRTDGTASISKDSEISGRDSASICESRS